MAKKIVKRAKPVDILRDDATAKAAMQIVGKPLKAVNEELDNIAVETGEGVGQRKTAAAFYAWGIGFRKNSPKFNESEYIKRFDHYASKHWPKGTKQPSDGTLDRYRSDFKAFAEAAFAKYDMRDLVQECVAIVNVTQPWRATRIRNLAALDAPPTKAAQAEEFTINAASGRTVNQGADTQIARFVSLGVKLAGDGKVTRYLEKNAHVAEWLEPMLREIIKQRKTDTATMKTKTAKAAVEKAEKVFPDIVEKAGRGRRANVGAVGHA